MKLYTLFFSLLLLTTQMNSQEPDKGSAIQRMLEAERSFARTSVSSGTRTAFYEHLAVNSLIFTDRWISNGKEFWSNRSPSPTVLKWKPEYMNIALSRDFGVSTGPWESQEYRPGTNPLATGYFLSVWEVQPDGEWRVILDAGITSPVNEMNLQFFFPEGDDNDNPAPLVNNNCKDNLQEAENRMNDILNNAHEAKIYRTFLGKGARLMRNGHLPSSENEGINVMTSSIPGSMIWKSSGNRSSRSEDLGFTYGYLENPAGNYVRIWERDVSGMWKVHIDMMSY